MFLFGGGVVEAQFLGQGGGRCQLVKARLKARELTEAGLVIGPTGPG